MTLDQASVRRQCKFADLKTYKESEETIRDARIHEVTTLATCRHPDQIRRFLKNHPVLLELLPEAFSHAWRVFGSETPLELEVVTDPEGAESKVLFAYMITSLAPAEALDLMDKLDYQWYLSQPSEILEIFSFNLHLV